MSSSNLFDSLGFDSLCSIHESVSLCHAVSVPLDVCHVRVFYVNKCTYPRFSGQNTKANADGVPLMGTPNAGDV